MARFTVRSCSVFLSHVILMFRCAPFVVAQCSNFYSFSALEHITVNRTNVTLLQLIRSNYKYGRAYVTMLRAGRSGVQIPAEGILFHSPKTSWAALECNQPPNCAPCRGWSNRGVTLTNHLHQKPSLRVRRAIPPPHLYAAWRGHDRFIFIDIYDGQTHAHSKTHNSVEPRF
jgi:hypothetical protein